MRAHRVLALAALVAAVAAACKEANRPLRVASVEVTASTGTLLVGDTVRLTATARDDGGKVLEDRSPVWSSSDSAVATVTGGLVRALKAGSATIIARVEAASGSLVIAVSNPGPTIGSVAPEDVVAGSGAFDLTVTGSGFVAGSVVVWNGQERPTQFGNATTLRASITAADVATPGTFNVTVRNPPPGGGTSAPVALLILRPNPMPHLEAISPNGSKVSGPAFTLSIVGSKLVSGATIHWNERTLQTTFHDSTYLTAEVPASLLSAAGPVAITVVNPAPGGGASNSMAFALPCVIPGPTLAAGQTRARLGAYFFDGWAGQLDSYYFKGLTFGPFQEREPLSGWQDKTICSIEQQLAWAHNMGLGFFLFEWYNGGVNPLLPNEPQSLNSALDIMRALPDRHGMQFALMYTNFGTFWIKPADWSAAIDEWMGYMTDPGYVRVDGKPLFVVWDIDFMRQIFGSSAAVASAFDGLRAAARAHGLPGVYVVGDIVTGYESGWFPDLTAAAADGYDAFSLYAYCCGLGGPQQPFSIISEAAHWIWGQAALHSPRPFIPVAQAGWDTRPVPASDTWFVRTPQEVAKLVSDAVAWATGHPQLRPEPAPAAPLALIMAWTDLGEGAYIVPTVGDGTSYGDALAAMLTGTTNSAQVSPRAARSSTGGAHQAATAARRQAPR